MYTKTSEIRTTARFSVSSLAFTTHSSYNSIYITLNNVSIYAAESNVTTAGVYTSSTMGVAGYAYNPSTIHSTNLTIQATKCNITSTGSTSITSMGFTSPMTFFNSSRLVIACCDSTVSSTDVGIAAVVCSDGVSAVATQWLLVRSQITATNICVNMRPSMGVSVASQVVVKCVAVGWGAASPYCSNNATWKSVYPSPAPVTLQPGDACLSANVSCHDLLPPPVPPIPWVDPIDDNGGATTSLTRSPSQSFSQTSGSASIGSHTASYHLVPSSSSIYPPSISHSRPTLPSPCSTVSLVRSLSQSLHVVPPSPLSPISHIMLSEEAARAVIASGTAAAALGGFVAATSMGHATRMGALMRSIECSYTSGELDSPSLVELPLQTSLGSQGGSLGAHAGSAVLTSVMLVVLPQLVCSAVHVLLSTGGVGSFPALRSLQQVIVSRYCLLSIAYITPNVLMSTVVVVGRGASSGAVVAVLCASIVPLLVGCIAGLRGLSLDVDVVQLGGGKWALQNRPSCSAYVETFGGIVDGCRDPTPYIVRVCFLEDVAASLVLSFLSGVSLSSVGGCEWVAVAMLVVSGFHLLYLVCIRPLRSRIESAMNSALCAVQVVMATLCLAIASGADNSSGVLMSVLGVVAVIQNASFFAQAAILAACACVNESRKKHLALLRACQSADSPAAMMTERALLEAPAQLQEKPLPMVLRLHADATADVL